MTGWEFLAGLFGIAVGSVLVVLVTLLVSSKSTR